MRQTVTTDESKAYVFVAVEHANSEVIGVHAPKSANRFEALEPVRGLLRPARADESVPPPAPIEADGAIPNTPPNANHKWNNSFSALRQLANSPPTVAIE